MKPKVLIVDDSLTVRMDLGEAFEAAGFAITLCPTAAACWEAIAREPYDLIVLDVLLPDGDGVDVLRELRGTQATEALPVLLLSTEAEVADRVRGLKTGADDYVGKPYDLSYLLARARELARGGLLQEPRTGAGAVLLIDDSPTFLHELGKAIESAGYKVLTASTGEEGLHVAAWERPCAIIVDGQLPGIDGATVVHRLKQDVGLRHIPCLLLTAEQDRDEELRALEAGADAYIHKDEDPALVLARLSAMLRSASAPAAFPSAAGLLGPKRILAVDDSPTYLYALAEHLKAEGYDVVPARSGQEALDLLAVQVPDCILLDLLMPGLSGQETCRRIKDVPEWRDVPLVILTALDEHEAMIVSLNAGADDYVPKSSEFEVLKARMRAQLRRRQFEDENRRIQEQLLRRELEAAETRASQELAETRASLLKDLEEKNQELEAFAYSASHDLRAPLRAMEGLSQALLEDYSDKLDETGLDYLRRIHAESRRTSQMVEDLLQLSRITRGGFQREAVDLTALARAMEERLRARYLDHPVDFQVQDGLVVQADGRLLRVALENLLGNAWKFTGKQPEPRVELGSCPHGGRTAYYVRDNGAGFDSARADKLFTPFHRLHTVNEFEGTGIGLATVQRIVRRHGGRIWAEAAVGRGATFYFTLGDPT